MTMRPPASPNTRFEKEILLHAPHHRVWQALTDARQFGAWFQARLDNTFVVGHLAVGRMTVPGYEHLDFRIMVERLLPERLFSFRWHPYAIDPTIDYALEPTTLVEFMLDDVQGDTLLTVAESGFDQLPPYRRDEAYRMSSKGWAEQLGNIQAYLKNTAARPADPSSSAP